MPAIKSRAATSSPSFSTVRKSRKSAGRSRTFSHSPLRMPVAFLNSLVARLFSYTASKRKLRSSSTASSTAPLIRISERPPASVSVTTSRTSAPMRADDELPRIVNGPFGRSAGVSRPARVDDALAGVTKRRVSEIVAERDGFGQLLVQPQHLGDRPRDLRDLERMRQPRAVVIAGRREEDLRLVLQPAKRLAVDDAIAIT